MSHVLQHRRRRAATSITTALVTVALLTAAGHGGATSDSPFALVATTADVGEAIGTAVRQGDPLLYVVDRRGTVTALDVASGATTVVLDVTDLVETGFNEQGLLGLAFDPGAPFAYVDYTAAGSGATVIAALPLLSGSGSGSGSDGTITFDRAGMRELLTFEQPYPNHNGGDLHVGPDGMLYVATGDGGAGGDPERHAQDPGSLLGKLLRIDPTPDDPAAPYAIPADNPFVDIDPHDGTVRPEIWALGLRNPWRISFDAATGDLWIADVGQGDIEEINLAPADTTSAAGGDAGRGANFGWSAFEGDAPFNDDVELVIGNRVDPVFTYRHDEGNCSVSGGVRVRVAAAPALEASYVFADYCSSRVYVLAVDGDGATAVVSQQPTVFDGPANPTSVSQGPDGAVYITAADGLYRFSPGS